VIAAFLFWGSSTVEQVRLIYEQIEEAKRYLLGGSLLQLRLALILLDNAAELMMHRELRWNFASYDEFVPKWEPARTEWIRAGLGPKYTEEERRDSEREFEPKMRILHLRLRQITEDDRRVLGVCHKLRCEAFHRGHIRAEILEQVCKLLYLTVAGLTLKLPFKSYSIPGGDLDAENASFLARFGFDSPYGLSTDKGRLQVRDKLVENIAFEATPFAETLSDDLLERLDRTVDGLAYVGESDDPSEIDYNLQHTQFWRELGAKMMKSGIREPQLGEEFRVWRAAAKARFTLAKIKRRRRMASAIRLCANPAAALDHYWAIDRWFKPLEEDVAESVDRYDEEINMRIHHGR